MQTHRFYFGRMFFLLGIMAAVVLLFLGRLYYLQVLHGSQYRIAARRLAEKMQPIPALRGKIYSSDNRLLASNARAYTLYLVRSAMPRDPRKVQVMVGQIAKVLQKDPSSLMAAVHRYERQGYNELKIAEDVPFSEFSALVENKNRYPGLKWKTVPVRRYLFHGSFSHIVGYTGAITELETQVLYNQGYKHYDTIGKTGVEKSYDTYLQGTPGVLVASVDAHGKRVGERQSTTLSKPPVSGDDLYLTVNSRYQALAERALGKRKGSVVILRPATGEVLAMASYPFFDANLFDSPGSYRFSTLSLSPDYPFLFRAVQSAIAPASTFKLLDTIALLDQKLITPSETIFDRGYYVFGNRHFKDWYAPGFGVTDLQKALEQSINVYFARMTQRINPDLLANYANRFGLGRRTGIDLPGESAGLIPTMEWKLRTQKVRWVAGDTVNFSIGQGYVLSTTLQIADLLAGIVNNGKIYRPYVVKKVVNSLRPDPVLQRTRQILYDNSDIDPSIYGTLRDDLRTVVTLGTAKNAVRTSAVAIAGKTGTGQIGLPDEFQDWFASYAPYRADGKVTPDTIVVVSHLEAGPGYKWWAAKSLVDVIYQAIFANQSFNQAVRTLSRRSQYVNIYFPLTPDKDTKPPIPQRLRPSLNGAGPSTATAAASPQKSSSVAEAALSPVVPSGGAA